jgi:tetratricopeptide (TPR) repeat protein
MVVTLGLCAPLAGCALEADPPKDYLDRWERGQDLAQNGDHTGARSVFREILSRYPRESFNPYVELLLSDCEHRLGNRGEAERLREGVARGTSNPELKKQAIAGLGMMDFEADRYDSAAARFREAAALEKEGGRRSRLLYQTGLALQRSGGFAEARKTYQQAIALAPESPQARACREQLGYPDHFFVQTGAFREASNAKRQADLLGTQGFPAEVVESDFAAGKLHCVRVGKFSKRREAVALKEKIAASDILPKPRISVKP